ncbi:MAG: ABC transporter substrate-binding protein [Treponema sp.]|jgi:NitT/TauT family transport system substrate-binding protein|nr:ABC transporter substrate-binding protein [Treponema sp.]
MKKHLRKLLLLILAGGVTAMLPAQTSGKVTIYGLKGPSGVGMIRLFEAPPRAAGFEISVEALAQADLMAAKFISGEAKIGILPPNVAAKIASSGKKIQIAAITGTGMLSLLSADPSVRRIEDLKGKTVEVAGQGATPDYVFRKILLSRGINPDSDLRLGYALAYPEIAQALIAGRVSLALLPEPFATMARNGNSNIKPVGDIQDEWIRLHGGADNVGGANYPMTALVVDGAFAAANDGLVKEVLKSLEASVKWVTANPAAAGALVEKHDLGLRAPVAAAAIPRSNYVFIPAAAARPGIEALFRAFLEFAPASIGGALPKDDFYYIPK